jgi:putative oxidoreductase
MPPVHTRSRFNLPCAPDAALLLARVSLASLFLFSGGQKLTHLQGAADWATSQGVPFAAQLMPLAGLFEIASGLMLVSGWHARQAAAALAAWIMVLGPLFHRFWDAPTQLRQIMMDDLFHHFVMFGGMLYVAVLGAGRWRWGGKESRQAPVPKT